MSKARLGGFAWLACLQFFVAEALAATAYAGYSYRFSYISDLGALSCARGCSPWHALMNASFLLQGVLIAGGLSLVWRELGGGGFGAFGEVCLAICAAGIFVVGLAPEDVAPHWHYLGATANLVGCNLAAINVGLGRGASPVARAGLLAGGLGLAACFALGGRWEAILGVGAIERLAAYPFVLWLAALGAALARRQ